MSGGTTSGGTATDFFAEVDDARQRGAVSYSCGTRKISFDGPPEKAVEKVPDTVVKELDYAQREQVIGDWLNRQGLDHEQLDALIQREMEAMSA